MHVDKLEHKALPLKVDDISKDSRTAVFAHATYDNVDRLGDICRPGMFTKSWSERKADVKLLIDHKKGLKPGKVVDLWETKAQAFTKAQFGHHTLGNDTLEMLDMGLIDSASFGFIATKANKIDIKGKKVRELKEVFHAESTLTNELDPVNPESRVILVNKAMDELELNLSLELKALSSSEQTLLKQLLDGSHSNMETAVNFSKTIDPKSDLYTWISYYISRQADGIGSMRSQLQWGSKELKAMEARAEKLEDFVRNSNASDECIQNIIQEAKALSQLVSRFDTANTHDDEPGASDAGNTTDSDILATLKLLKLKASF